MLKNIPSIISPELMKTLMEMGHGDEIVIADGNFPSGSKSKKVIRADGIDGPSLLEAILKFLPLDRYVKEQAFLMAKVDGDKTETPIWEVYIDLMKKGDPDFKEVGMLDKPAFYKRAEEAFAVIATSEKALYANLILKKGVV
ncbi:MAG: fucose isomerase [Spirochaetales bacterium]|nr:fucose isomerase [Spirochaetales bacterium]